MCKNGLETDQTHELDSEKAFEILVNVFESCGVEVPDSCHKYFEKQELSDDN